MDGWIIERQIKRKRGDGEDDAIWKKQKIDDNNMHEVDIDMMSKHDYRAKDFILGSCMRSIFVIRDKQKVVAK